MTGRGATQSEELVTLARDRFDLGTATTGEAFALPAGGPRVARPLRGSGRSVRAALAYEYANRHGRAPSSQALADAMLVLEGAASQAPPTELALRVAGTPASGLLLDLGQPDGRAVRIAAGGWQAEATPPPTVFRRTALSGPLPDPERGGDLDELGDLLNVSAADWPLLVGHLVGSLFPGIPHPVVALTGEHGCAKTAAARMLAAVVDPSPAQTRSAPRNDADWAVAASGSWTVALDNLSGVPEWLSDCVCRAVTGDGLVRRALYSDADLSVLAFRRVILMNGIDLGRLRGDLADRMLRIGLDVIPPDRRLLDEDVAERWARMHPRVLGGLLDLTVKVLAVLPDVRLDSYPRMADFARVLAAADRVRGTDGLGRYLGAARATAAEVVEGDPVAQAVRDHVEAHGDWTGTASALAALLEPARPSRDWPATGQGMAAALRRAAPSLRALGIDVAKGRNNASRTWTVSQSGEEANPGVTSGKAVTRAADQRKRGDTLAAESDSFQPGDEKVSPGNGKAVTPPNAADQQVYPSGDSFDACDTPRRPLSDLDATDPAVPGLRISQPRAEIGPRGREYQGIALRGGAL